MTRQKLPVIRGNSSQIYHLFQNLISNALKFRGEANPLIEITADLDKDDVIFCVRDNGIGIDMKYGEQIFEVFRRLHGADRYAGTGIGLALCKKIVERYGGKIWVESTPGQGSSFFFTIPQKNV
jgi:light-regulated signal transduction histidine kinase (bacteriophytochrome)